jgi:hypothetical protein
LMWKNLLTSKQFSTIAKSLNNLGYCWETLRNVLCSKSFMHVHHTSSENNYSKCNYKHQWNPHAQAQSLTQTDHVHIFLFNNGKSAHFPQNSYIKMMTGYSQYGYNINLDGAGMFSTPCLHKL